MTFVDVPSGRCKALDGTRMLDSIRSRVTAAREGNQLLCQSGRCQALDGSRAKK